jgi:Phage gp6-like head-tail connector protein
VAYGDLTTLADVKAWLQSGQSAFPPTDDALLTRLIGATSQYIQTWLNRRIAQTDYIEVRDGNGGNRLGFASTPVSAVLSLAIDDMAISPCSSSWSAGYLFTPTQLLVRGYSFTRRAQNVVVIYTAGYASPPLELAQACIELVASRYRERTRIGEVTKSLGAGDTVTYSQRDMSAAVTTVLQQYRVVAPVSGSAPMLAPTATDPALLMAAL